MKTSKITVWALILAVFPVVAGAETAPKLEPTLAATAVPEPKATPEKKKAKKKAKPAKAVAKAEKKSKAYWTCPHEGGHFDHPGKCSNSWCGMDLVKVDGEEAEAHHHEEGEKP